MHPNIDVFAVARINCTLLDTSNTKIDGQRYKNGDKIPAFMPLVKKKRKRKKSYIIHTYMYANLLHTAIKLKLLIHRFRWESKPTAF